jgi:hypothetical protein
VLRVRWVVLAGLASCGVRAPAAIDVATLLRARGPIEARRELEIRMTSDPRDVAARLALAALDEQLHRPSEALAALEAVVALGGPLGVRWHGEDRARLGRLLAARGRARLGRGAATATADLARARELGAPITDDELWRARAAGAVVLLRHSDAETREAGRRALAALAATGDAQAVTGGWLGARPGAAAAARGRFGAWLWTQGARRAAWDELSAWHDQSHAPRDPQLQDAYLAAARWWTPLDRPGPPADELSGAGRCAFGGCLPREVAGDEGLERAYLEAPLAAPVRDPADAAALVVITLHQALRGEASWGPALASRVDLAAVAEPVALAALPSFAAPIVARFAGHAAAVPDPRPAGRAAVVPGDGETPAQRLVIGAARALAGAPAGELAALIGDAPYAEALRRVAEPPAAFAGDARAEAAARHALATIATTDVRQVASADSRRVASADSPPAPAAEDPLRATAMALLRPIAAAFGREPLVADRLARDAVAGAEDAAAMHATIGALFDGLGDPARARAAWQAAVDASAEPAFVRGLAEAQARQGDADAALVTATAAAAASGDPAVVWVAVARALAGAGKDVHALDAAHSAIELAGPDTLAGALDVAITSSRALGRDAQAARLTAQRAQLCAGTAAPRDGDPTDARAALDAHQAQPSDATIAHLWTAARWNPREVALRVALRAALTDDDPRRAAVSAELVELAGDRDPDVRRAAVAALR